jgi:LuxR family maltose regulon positive regulatory protein
MLIKLNAHLVQDEAEDIKDYIEQLLQSFQTEPFLSQRKEFSAAALPYSLSEREIQVLKLLGEGLSNQEIASQLYISLNTVKAHLKSVYGKLEVNNRVQAIARGRELDLI